MLLPFYRIHNRNNELEYTDLSSDQQEIRRLGHKLNYLYPDRIYIVEFLQDNQWKHFMTLIDFLNWVSR
jgi:hypothetical protein